MEKVDIYDKNHKFIGISKEKHSLKEGDYRLSAFIWIINSNDELLIQQRMADAKFLPNVWETASGGVKEGETSLEGIIRETKEEIGLEVSEDELSFIGSYARKRDFVEVYLLKKDVNIDELKYKEVEKVEVQDVKWAKIKDFENMCLNKEAVDSGYFIFKNYYENFYHVEG